MTDRLERLINLVIALRETRRPLTAAEIRRRVAGYGQDDAEAFRRMFERDKADLRSLGVPVDTVPVDRWEDTLGYRIDPRRYDLPDVRLDPDELTALAVAVAATGLTDSAGSGLLKLGVDAGEPDAARPQRTPPLDVALDAPHRAVLMEAQLERRRVRFDYARPGRPPERRTVEPHALVHRRGRWYLVGHDRDRRARRAFRLDRIAGRVTSVGEPDAFPPAPADVGVDDVVPATPAGAPATAVVHAAPDVAWLVARRARGGGRAVPPPDPDEDPPQQHWTAFDVTVGDPEAFVTWALDFGADLVVVSPAELRAAVVSRLRQALAL